MTGLWTAWRKAGRLVAAVALVVLTLGPSLDSLICGPEANPAAVAVAADQHRPTVVDGAVGDHRAGGYCDDCLGPCAHGHCHHGASYVPADLATVAAPAERAARLVLDLASVPTSDPKFELKRPPRA